MQDRSVSSVPSPPSPSHTSTDQWQSFESRMRQRRANRCLLKAEMALQAGLIDVARRACADTREMDPTLPALAALEQNIAALPARRRYRGFAAVAACLTALALTASLAWVRRSPPPHRHARAQADVLLVAPASGVVPLPPRVEPAPVQPDPEPVARRDAAVAPPEIREAVPTRSVHAPEDSVELADAPRPVPLQPSPLPALAAPASTPLPPPADPESAALAVSRYGRQ